MRVARTGDIGPKGTSLLRLGDAGLPVPPAQFVEADAYRTHIGGTVLRALVSSRVRELAHRQPDTEETPTAEAALSEIRGAIRDAELDPDIEERIRAIHRDLGGGPVAVRSSATAEDLPGHSFAGQHGTYFAGDTDAVVDRVKDCWASLWTDRAFAYRDRQGFDHETVDMAVIIQRLVPADAAGVAFTRDPITGADETIVEACTGLGEALVAGKVSPDRFVLDTGGTLISRAIGKKRSEIVADPDGHVRERAIEGDRGMEPAIADDVAVRIAEHARRAEDAFGTPLDLEWALTGDQVWFVQARPITGLPAAALGAERYVWSNVNTGEVLPDVVTPMTWSIMQGFVEAMFTGLFGRLGIAFGDIELIGLVGGRAYFNVTALADAFRKVPAVRSIDLSEVLGGMQDHVDIPAELLERNVDAVRGSVWRTLRALPGTVVYLSSRAPRKAGPFCESWRARDDAAEARLMGGLDDDGLLAGIDGLVSDLTEMADGLGFAGVAMIDFNTLRAACERWLDDEDGSITTGLLAGGGTLASAEAGLAMLALADAARADPRVQAAIVADGDWEATEGRLRMAGASAHGFLEAWDAFMTEHGHHARGELELGNARWRERPDYVLDVVRGYLEAEAATAITLRERGEVSRELAAECRARLGPLRQWVFDRLLSRARGGAAARENVKNEGVRRMALIRAYLLELGRRWSRRGLLEAPEDIFFVEYRELVGLDPDTGDIADTISRRRREHDAWTGVTPPPVVIGTWMPEEDTGTSGSDRSLRSLAGLGVSPGVVRGPARVIESVSADARVEPGEILVAPFTDPGWTPYFVPAAGIVMDMGGMLSHGSIIAREYGIPAVANVGPATSIIATGQLVEVDGGAGTVRIVDEADTVRAGTTDRVPLRP